MQVFKRLRKGGIARLYKGLGVSASRSALSGCCIFGYKRISADYACLNVSPWIALAYAVGLVIYSRSDYQY